MRNLLSLCTLLAAVAFSPHPPQLLVVNQLDHSVSFIDPATTRAAAYAEHAVTGHEIAVTPDGRTAFVPIYGDSGVGKRGTDGSTLQVIDVASRTLIHTIDFGHGVRPHCAVYDRRRNLLYVTTELDQAIAIIDPQSFAVVGRIPTGQAESHMVALSHDGRFGYTANVGPGTVSVLDLGTRRTIAVIPVSSNIQRIAVSTDDRFVYTADQTSPRMAVIDTRSNAVTASITVPAIAYGTALTPDGRFLLAAMRTPGAVALIDVKTNKYIRSIETGGTPTEILIGPDGKMAYVSCGGNVVVIDLETMQTGRALKAGSGADGMAWAN